MTMPHPPATRPSALAVASPAAAHMAATAGTGLAHRRVALVGGGPTSVYTLWHLIALPRPLDITLFEREPVAGPGMPYRDGINAPSLLSNIDSREVPPLADTLAGFLRGCDRQALAEIGLERAEITDDSFFPRLALGRYFIAQLAVAVAQGRARGHRIEIAGRAEVTAIVPGPDGLTLDWHGPSGGASGRFDDVVIATGHTLTRPTRQNGVILHQPWPSAALRRFLGQRVGILGSSLSAIDAAVALAELHGRFSGEGDDMRWLPGPAAEGFAIEMMSRKGLLPEADWYYPLPLPPLPGLTPARAAQERAAGRCWRRIRCLRRSYRIWTLSTWSGSTVISSRCSSMSTPRCRIVRSAGCWRCTRPGAWG